MAIVLVVAGGYRTGSTLQYNLLGTYLEHAGLGRRGGYVLPDDADALLAQVADEPGWVVVKCHQIAEGFHDYHRPAAWGDAVRRGDALAVMTERDPEGVARSMCRKFGIAPDALHESHQWRENEANVRLWRPLARTVQQYDDLVERPRHALWSLLRRTGVPVRPSAVFAAARASGREQAARAQAAVPEGTWDPVSLLHWDHIGDVPEDARRG